MKNKIALFFILLGTIAYGQENSKVDSLGMEINNLKEKISELKEKIQSEITQNGYFLKIEKKYSFSKLLLKDKKYGKTIDTLKAGETIKIIGKEIGAYKVVYGDKTGFMDESDLKVEDDSTLEYLKYKYKSSGKSSSSGSTYVKGHYRKTKSGKRVYVKGHRRKN